MLYPSLMYGNRWKTIASRVHFSHHLSIEGAGIEVKSFQRQTSIHTVVVISLSQFHRFHGRFYIIKFLFPPLCCGQIAKR